MQMAKKRGMNNVDLLRMREIAKKEAEKMEIEATERAFLYMLAIPLNILFHDYWQKSAKKRAPKFIEEVTKYYLAVQEGVVTDQELADLLFDLAGVKIEADWLKGGKNEH
jgi:hypothetical protein